MLIDTVLVVVVSKIITFGPGLLAMGAAQTVSTGLAIAYFLYFTTHYGQTFGKMAMKVKITHLDGSAITFKTALLRKSVDFALIVLNLIFYWIQMAEMKGIVSSSAPTQDEITKMLADNKGFWIYLSLASIWTIANLVSFLANPRKRALHDLIAGTIVIDVSKTLKQA